MNTIGIDIGGTFTDVAALLRGRMFYAKTPSSSDVVTGVISGIRMVLEEAEIDLSDPPEITYVHGTTIATNTLLEKTGAKLALLATHGHRDALELGRMKRSNLYDLRANPETPAFLIPRRLRIGIRERVDGKGQISLPLDENQIIREIGILKEKYGIEACAVCYLNSYVNPENERRTQNVIAEHYPDIFVSISSDISPVFREYERLCATAFDAYVRPKVINYVKELKKGLAAEGGGRLHLMQSAGGIGTAEMTIEKPVTMFLSGPAAGVVGARHIGNLSGRSNLIGFDVGGTSTDVCFVKEGQVQVTKEGRIAGYPLRIPMVEMETVGSGGGSIAWVDAGSGLHVGPQSAGSVPGPACYGRGGAAATSTDASVVLGYLNPDYFAKGTLRLEPDLAHAAVSELGKLLALSKEETALGIFRVLVSQMSEAIKLITVKRGIDPRNFTLVSFGGGGGLYSAAVAKELGIKEVLIPQSPGTLSAFGMLVSDFETDGIRTVFVPDAANANTQEIELIFDELEEAGRKRLQSEGLVLEDIRARRVAEMRYADQAYELDVPIGNPYNVSAQEVAIQSFNRIHHEVYGYSDDSRRIEIINVRVVTYKPSEELPTNLFVDEVLRNKICAPIGRRNAIFADLGQVSVPIYRRTDIPMDREIVGPAIIEQEDTTVVIGIDQYAIHDKQGSLIIKC